MKLSKKSVLSAFVLAGLGIMVAYNASAQQGYYNSVQYYNNKDHTGPVIGAIVYDFCTDNPSVTSWGTKSKYVVSTRHVCT